MSVDPGLTELAVTPVPRRLGGQASDQADHAGFGCAVHGQHGHAPGGGGRGHGQEPPIARRGSAQEGGDPGSGGHQHPAEIDVEHRLLLVLGHLPLGHPAGDDAGRGDDRVHTAEPALGHSTASVMTASEVASPTTATAWSPAASATACSCSAVPIE